MPDKRIVIDCNVLISYISKRDSLHDRAVALLHDCMSTQTELIYFDTVVSESLSVLGRRSEEQKRSSEFGAFAEQLITLVPEQNILWLSKETNHYYSEIIELMKKSNGRLNFNDCLIAIGCRELHIDLIASFDQDFDDVHWLQRISNNTSPLFA